MNQGLVVKLRPAGPWRIGPDSGARNRVDAIYHSDSLYSAVTSAMSRMGSLAAWLDATARSQTPAVCFSSCFPFLDDIGFVVPPRTIWPPTSPAAMSARVRWKSARFIPLSVVESILSGKKLNENQWSVDGASGCLVPAGKPGPFRTNVRWNAAVDRLSGCSERHATACIEFREGCGLWTVVGLGLLTLGLIWCFAVRLPWPFVLAVLGIAACSLNGRFVLRRLAEKNAARVVRRGDGHCLGGFLSVKTWLLVAVMMTSGILLRRSGVPHPILGVLYSAIGTALLAGSIPLWKARRQLGGEDPFRRAPGKPGA